MDLSEAITAHIRWKIRLVQCIRGQADPPKAADVARDDACALGKWLAGEGMRYASSGSSEETRTAHAVFHLRAAEVVSALERGDRSQAEAMLEAGSPYAAASDAIILALAKLRGEVRRAAAGSAKS